MKQQVEKERKEVNELKQELQRINSAKNMKNLKDSALAPNIPQNAPGSEGFTLTHLILVALIAILVGALAAKNN